MIDRPPSSGNELSNQPSRISGRRVLLGLLVVAIVLQLFFVWLVWGTRKAKESLPADHPVHRSTRPPAEHITDGDE